jgi:large subunit ribosomal protein L18
MKKITRNAKIRRKLRVRSKICGESKRPRISVFRSNKYIYAQAIDDVKRITLASFSSLKLKTLKEKITKVKRAHLVGKELARILKEKKINQAIFDRGWYAYKGQVKALAEGIRSGGIKI